MEEAFAQRSTSRSSTSARMEPSQQSTRAFVLGQAERHLSSLTQLAILITIVCYAMVQLQEILIPFALAVFLLQLFEKVAKLLAKPRDLLVKQLDSYCANYEQATMATSTSSARHFTASGGANDHMNLGDHVSGGARTPTGIASTTGPTSSATVVSPLSPTATRPSSRRNIALFYSYLKKAIHVISDLLIILICLASVLLFVFLVFYGLSNLFDKSKFSKYYQSPRVQDLINYLRSLGVEITVDEVVRKIEDPLTQFVGGVLHFLSTGFLVLMILGFLLLGVLQETQAKKTGTVTSGSATTASGTNLSLHHQRQHTASDLDRELSDVTTVAHVRSSATGTVPGVPIVMPTTTGVDRFKNTSTMNGASIYNSEAESDYSPSIADIVSTAASTTSPQHLHATVAAAELSMDHALSNNNASKVTPFLTSPTTQHGAAPPLLAARGTRDPRQPQLPHHTTSTRSSPHYFESFAPKAKDQIQKYILLKTLMSLILGCGVGTTLLAVQVDFWFVFTVMAFLLNFIPTVGGAISLILPTVITFLDPTKQVSDILIVFIIPGLLHILCGNVLEPYFFGSSFELHPIVIMFCLVVWSSLWGVVGAVLSVPLTCCLKLALEPHIKAHPYALFAYRAMEFQLPTEEQILETDYISSTPRPTPRTLTDPSRALMSSGGGTNFGSSSHAAGTTMGSRNYHSSRMSTASKDSTPSSSYNEG
ncbi:unnamed protein product [Amoebophrya sp. A120]|nr:unnamed protein product [Amoebophrya sp. A120]|eukprot:GSA120T00023830001.1